MESVAERICHVGRLMFERRLADIAGGNISCRHGDRIYMTPTGAGQKWHWDLQPSDILCAPVDTDELLENPAHSKEAISHLLVYRAFPEVNGIIHSHPFHVLPYCAALKPIPAVIKSAQVYADRFEFIDEAPMYSREQGELIVAQLQDKREKFQRFAAALLMPKHGIFIAGGSLNQAIDCLERMDTNAWCNLAQRMIC